MRDRGRDRERETGGETGSKTGLLVGTCVTPGVLPLYPMVVRTDRGREMEQDRETGGGGLTL